MDSQTFGEYLHSIRIAKGLSLEEVATAISYDADFIRQIECNKIEGTEDFVARIASTYNLELESLMAKFLTQSIYYRLRQHSNSLEIVRNLERRLKKEGIGTRFLRSRDEIITLLKQYFRGKPVRRAYVFGSFAAEGTISADSDLDIMLELEQPHQLTLLDLVQMQQELSEQTGREIDLVEMQQLLPHVRESIADEKILVYAS